MKRLFTQRLKGWKDSKYRKPLIVRGARQVGKSWVIREFGETCYEGKVHIIDFERKPEWFKVFDPDLDPVRIMNELEMLLNEKITPGKDLLFFDEVQAAPRAIMSLRYFYEEMPELHLIAAGSLLEFALKDISFPVGRVQIMSLGPMNFYEFLLARKKKKLAEIIISPPEELPETVHTLLIEHLRHYMYVGGMPECVGVWCETQRMTHVFEVQDSLVETYRQDFSKYAPYSDKRSLNHAMTMVAKNVGRQIKYTRLSDEFSGPTNKKAYELLLMARIFHKVRSASPASLPLAATASESRFKSLLVDLGLMRSLNDIPANIEYVKNDLLAMYNGALAEQFAGQEFYSAGNDQLFYWTRESKSSSAEVDYLLAKNNKIFPVEVKGGASGKLKSLHLLMKQCPDIEQAYVLSTAPYAEIPEKKLCMLPVYYAYQLAQTGH
ncbi:MAG: DUF4143 domain-containing protein [Bacteroidia bacterium]|nr:MAG: DUF4143 domain-containing protein [Bacteroidia bacterium]